MRFLLRALLALYALYLALALLIATPLLNLLPAGYVQDHYGRELRSQWVILNPFKLSFDLKSLALYEPDGTEFLALGDSSINLSLASLWREGIVLDEVRFTDIALRLARMDEARFNFSDLLPPADPGGETGDSQAQEAAAPGITVNALKLHARSVRLEDLARATPYRGQWQDIELQATEVSTVLAAGKPYSLALSGPHGGRLQWRGELSVAGANSRGQLDVTDLSLPDLGDIAAPWIAFRVDSGRLGLSGSYRIDWSDALSYAVEGGVLTVDELAVAPKPAASLPDTGLQLASLSVTDIGVDGAGASARVGLLRLGGLQVDGFMEGDTISLRDMFAGPPPAAAPDPAVGPEQTSENPWRASIGRVELADSGVNWRSAFTAPATTQVSAIQASLDDLAWPLQGESPLSLQLQVNDQAALHSTGALALDSGRGDIDFRLQGLQLPWIDPALPGARRAVLARGALDLPGSVS
ncbi:MAG: DUF748 domain-containing protein, partial [Halioglobus sp.]|nr:DUF748 domain-containing protein [Halioglobus sp.]